MPRAARPRAPSSARNSGNASKVRVRSGWDEVTFLSLAPHLGRARLLRSGPVSRPLRGAAMKAMVHHQFGRASQVLRLEEMPSRPQHPAMVSCWCVSRPPRPTPTTGTSSAVSPGSCARPGRVAQAQTPGLGGDFAGVVEAVGVGDVGGFAVGDEVYGFSHGAFAEYVAAAPRSRARPIPGAGSVTAARSRHCLGRLKDVGGIEAGQKVLIIGASGGIGTRWRCRWRWLGARR